MSATMVTTAYVIRARSPSKLAGRSGTKTSSWVYPHTEKSRGVKLGDRGGKVIVPPRPIQTATARLRWERTSQLRTSRMPSGGLNGNLRTRRNFWDISDQIVTSNSEVMTAEFCITNLRTSCIVLYCIVLKQYISGIFWTTHVRY